MICCACRLFFGRFFPWITFVQKAGIAERVMSYAVIVTHEFDDENMRICEYIEDL